MAKFDKNHAKWLVMAGGLARNDPTKISASITLAVSIADRLAGILTLTVRQQLGDRVRESKVRLVDLAGNERWAPGRNGATKRATSSRSV